MDIHYKASKYEPTPEILRQVESQVGALERFTNGSPARAEIELSRAIGGQQKGDVWRAELTIDCEGKQYRAESTKTKLSHAITTVTRDVAREFSRAKKKDQHFFKRGSAMVKRLLRGAE